MSQSANNSPHRQTPKFSVAITTAGYKNLINNTLGDPERAKRFIGSVTSAVAVNPVLQECEAGTILAAALLGESLNLSPSPQLGQYYMVPFEVKVKDANGKIIYLKDENGKNLKDARGRWIAETVKKAQFVLGYKGYIQLALRSGYYADLDVIEIRTGEYLGRDKTTGKHCFEFIEDDDRRDTMEVIGYMAYFEYLNGFKKVIYWTKKKMMSHADQYSPAFSAAAYEKLQKGEISDDDLWKYSSFWYKEFDDMAKKTMLRQLISKWGVMSTEMQRVMAADASIIEIGAQNELVTTTEEQLALEQPDLQPEAVDVVENINLDSL